MKKLIYGFALVASIGGIFSLSSCEPKKIDPNNQGIDEYMPVDIENWWLYEASDGTIFKRYYTGRDTAIDGFNFNYFEQIDTANGTIVKEFYGKFENNYYTLLKLNDEGTAFVKAIVLNGDPKLGDTWENTGNFTYGTLSFYAKTEGKILSMTDTFTVNGELIDNIVVTENRIYAKYNPLDTWLDCGTVKTKFKKGKGIIGEEYNITVLGVNKNYSNWLLKYHIK